MNKKQSDDICYIKCKIRSTNRPVILFIVLSGYRLASDDTALSLSLSLDLASNFIIIVIILSL